MARAPTPQEEDRRRVCRERRTLVGERVRHVNRIKGLLAAQGVFGHEPLRRGRRDRLEDLRTGGGRSLPVHRKAQIMRELDRLELLLKQLKTVAAERDGLLHRRPGAQTPHRPVAVRHRRGRHRGGHDEDSVSADLIPSGRTDQYCRIQVAEPK
jgi:transposase